MRARKYALRARPRARKEFFLRALTRVLQPHSLIVDSYGDIEVELRLGREAGACVVLFDDGQNYRSTPVDICACPHSEYRLEVGGLADSCPACVTCA